jgi:hypothetical protein
MSDLTHLDARGHARMVDVGAKAQTRRVAIARGLIRMSAPARAAIRDGAVPKGDVLATARIEFGRGQCGACAAARATQIAADVSVCANYIPCDDVTRSEIVVPVFGRNAHNEPEDAAAARRMIAVFDVDSPVLGNFNEVDKAGLEALLAAHF